ncbi:DNA-binding XRE family transcriptional regulator [Variovorax beijingensis]|uniref:DNA-binding XRE family transcriptional regulator n=2 Tax=Variovorax TaxID=34072 RepID=A0AAE3Y358_VARPD|nr:MULTISPECIES: helix-turn-helix transcriptional regulator [Variovorax]MDP9968725.1 DNA-binding XRE family transcriptional regulator [Variovorax paradoxus]MDR6430228.1 DNA-binding XRE family transcriptional regulator [Variovorax paradoxus]MDR6456884.1 DNA-binding XRE family transcriptional regulator [Variovorax paradoxus]TWD72993.1 DNA-binding XRE family transcriptional regulator [Variovorax beijingensis]
MKRVKFISPPPDLVVSDSKAFGASIRAARCAANMTLADAALLLGVARQTLANLETAKSSVSLDTALRAAREFGVSILAVPGGQREGVRRALASLQPGVEGMQDGVSPGR